MPRLGDICYIILFYDCPKELWEKRQGSGANGILYFASFVGKNSTLPKYLIHIFDHLYLHLAVWIGMPTILKFLKFFCSPWKVICLLPYLSINVKLCIRFEINSKVGIHDIFTLYKKNYIFGNFRILQIYGYFNK